MKARLLIAAVACAACLGGAMIASQRSAAEMSGAAQKWLTSLSEDQRGRATFAFDSEERLRWHFVPNEMHPRKGVQFKEMSEPQRALATGATTQPRPTGQAPAQSTAPPFPRSSRWASWCCRM